jgi:hypothetical protein
MFSITDILSSAICLIGLCVLIPSVVRSGFQENYNNRHRDLHETLYDENLKHDELLKELESINKAIHSLKCEIIQENSRFLREKDEISLEHEAQKEKKKHKLEKELMMKVINDALTRIQPTLVHRFIQISKNV